MNCQGVEEFYNFPNLGSTQFSTLLMENSSLSGSIPCASLPPKLEKLDIRRTLVIRGIACDLRTDCASWLVEGVEILTSYDCPSVSSLSQSSLYLLTS